MRSSFVFLFVVNFYVVQFAQLSISPTFPAPGDQLTLTYDVLQSKLVDCMDLEIIAHRYEEGAPIAQEVLSEIHGDRLKATYQTTEKTELVSFLIRDRNDANVLDNNGNLGYIKYMYHDQKPVQGAYYAEAMIHNSWGTYFGLERDTDKALQLMENEIDLYGELDDEDNPVFLMLLSSKDTVRTRTLALAALSRMEKVKNPTEEDMSLQLRYLGVVEERKKYNKLKEKILKKYPYGEIGMREMYEKFREYEEWSQRDSTYRECTRIFDADSWLISNMAQSLASRYGGEGDWDKFDMYIKDVPESRRAVLYNNIAWGLSGESMDGEPTELGRALELSKKSIEMVKNEVGTSKPDYMVEKDWKRNLGRMQSMYEDTYALLLYHNGQLDSALQHQKISCVLRDFEDPDLNERYARYYQNVHGNEASIPVLEKIIRDGHANKAIKNQYREIFVDHYSKEEMFEKYIAELESEANQRLKEELFKKLIDKEAPDFILKDLDGNDVSLSNLNDKVVVLDFWATWCGPCISSFPGMQQSVNHFSDDEDVVFLFVNTWENGEDKEETVKTFMENQEYNFHILMDKDNKVVKDYKVQGIPTKFILGKDSKIKYKSVGFGGTDALIEELEVVITYLKEN